MSILSALYRHGLRDPGWKDPYRGEVRCAVLDIDPAGFVSVGPTVSARVPHDVERTGPGAWKLPNLGWDYANGFQSVNGFQELLRSHSRLLTVVGRDDLSSRLSAAEGRVTAGLCDQLAQHSASSDVKGFLFSLDKTLVLDMPAVRNWWARTWTDMLSDRFFGERWTDYLGPTPTPDPSAVCLVTGRRCKPVRTFPKASGRPLAGKTPIVSWNEPAYQFAGRDQGDNFPVCAEVARALKHGLERLLTPDSQDRFWRTLSSGFLPSGDGVLAIWSEDGADDGADAMINLLFHRPVSRSDEDQAPVSSMLEQRSRIESLPDSGTLCLLDIHATKGRVRFSPIVRVLFQTARANVLRFLDESVVRKEVSVLSALIRITPMRSKSGRSVPGVGDNHAAAFMKAVVALGSAPAGMSRSIHASYRPKRPGPVHKSSSNDAPDTILSKFEDTVMRDRLIPIY